MRNTIATLKAVLIGLLGAFFGALSAYYAENPDTPTDWASMKRAAIVVGVPTLIGYLLRSPLQQPQQTKIKTTVEQVVEQPDDSKRQVEMTTPIIAPAATTILQQPIKEQATREVPTTQDPA